MKKRAVNDDCDDINLNMTLLSKQQMSDIEKHLNIVTKHDNDDEKALNVHDRIKAIINKMKRKSVIFINNLKHLPNILKDLLTKMMRSKKIILIVCGAMVVLYHQRNHFDAAQPLIDDDIEIIYAQSRKLLAGYEFKARITIAGLGAPYDGSRELDCDVYEESYAIYTKDNNHLFQFNAGTASTANAKDVAVTHVEYFIKTAPVARPPIVQRVVTFDMGNAVEGGKLDAALKPTEKKNIKSRVAGNFDIDININLAAAGGRWDVAAANGGIDLQHIREFRIVDGDAWKGIYIFNGAIFEFTPETIVDEDATTPDTIKLTGLHAWDIRAQKELQGTELIITVLTAGPPAGPNANGKTIRGRLTKLVTAVSTLKSKDFKFNAKTSHEKEAKFHTFGVMNDYKGLTHGSYEYHFTIHSILKHHHHHIEIEHMKHGHHDDYTLNLYPYGYYKGYDDFGLSLETVEEGLRKVHDKFKHHHLKHRSFRAKYQQDTHYQDIEIFDDGIKPADGNRVHFSKSKHGPKQTTVEDDKKNDKIKLTDIEIDDQYFSSIELDIHELEPEKKKKIVEDLEKAAKDAYNHQFQFDAQSKHFWTKHDSHNTKYEITDESIKTDNKHSKHKEIHFGKHKRTTVTNNGDNKIHFKDAFIQKESKNIDLDVEHMDQKSKKVLVHELNKLAEAYHHHHHQVHHAQEQLSKHQHLTRTIEELRVALQTKIATGGSDDEITGLRADLVTAEKKREADRGAEKREFETHIEDLKKDIGNLSRKGKTSKGKLETLEAELSALKGNTQNMGQHISKQEHDTLNDAYHVLKKKLERVEGNEHEVAHVRDALNDAHQKLSQVTHQHNALHHKHEALMQKTNDDNDDLRDQVASLARQNGAVIVHKNGCFDHAVDLLMIIILSIICMQFM